VGTGQVRTQHEVTDAADSGQGLHVIAGVPGQWSTNDVGALTVTAAVDEGVRINGATAEGTVEVTVGSALEFHGGRMGFASGSNGAYSGGW